ncbi:MAG: DUF4198 domain-containing protein [Alphaproteobacteria bacterium]|nr:DUF4198 domain-containing protein [Alphaproteobacteria bacterium]
MTATSNLQLLFCAAVVWLTIVSSAPGFAHEFWISPERYKVEAGGRLVAVLLTGDKFEGYTSPYIPEDFRRFDILLGGKTIKVTGRLGDDLALDMAVSGEGLGVIVHQTAGFFISYKEEGKFEGLLRDKGVQDVLKLHRARGLPDTGFRERFIRFAKCLVAVGHGRGQDAETGLETEFVAGANPYQDDVKDGVPVRLLFKGKARVGAQVEVFTRSPTEEVALELLRTDQEGRVVVPAKPGFEYLLNAVVFRPLEAEDPANDPVWESLWAQFTYTIPPKR